MGNNPRLKLHAFPFVVNKFFTLIMSNTPLIHRDDNRIVVICFLPQKKRIRALCKCFLLVAQRSTLPFKHFIFWRTDVFFMVESLIRDFFVVFLPSCACWIRGRERIYCTFVRHPIAIWHYIFIRESNICHVSLTRCANDGGSTFIVVAVAHRV